jgi:hypothetical protein
MASPQFLSPLNYKFQLLKIPTFVDYVQNVDFPRIDVGVTAGLPNPFQTIAVPGEHMEFADLRVTFKIDSNMQNYTELFDWIQAIGKPDTFTQYANLVNEPKGSGLGPQVDAQLLILDANLKAFIRFDFIDLYPAELSGFTLDYTLEDVEYVTAEVTFKYREYQYSRI